MTTPSDERLRELISRTGPHDMLHVNDEADMNAALRELLALRASAAGVEQLRKDAEAFQWMKSLPNHVVRITDIDDPRKCIMAYVAKYLDRGVENARLWYSFSAPPTTKDAEA